jgi:ribose 1,5-bisphosphokinase
MLILIVGPSGAGKDTLLNAVRADLAADASFRFVRRVITRPPDPDGEDHIAVSEAEFAAMKFALQWQAHGTRYGIPGDIEADLRRGMTVIASVSREIIADAYRRFGARVIQITASPAVLAARLAHRGREGAGDIAERLARTVPLPADVPVATIVNDGPVVRGADLLRHLLTADPMSIGTSAGG